jgi:hypothetical protein
MEKELIKCIGRMCGVSGLHIRPDLYSGYCAYDMDVYDGAPDAGPQYVGEGASVYDAVMDLLDQMAEDDNGQ